MTATYTPFVYPRSLHKRKHTPPHHSNYRGYKPYLAEEFGNKCIYCRIPDGIQGSAGFGVEHYKPKKQFPSLETEYNNLFYCCNPCNSKKGDYWPTTAQLRRSMFAPNPCDHVMSDHVTYYGSKVRNKSFAGEFMVGLLDLNDPARIEFRKDIITTINTVLDKYKQVRSTVRALNKLIRTEKNAAIRTRIEHSKNNHQNNLNRLKAALFRLTADKQFNK